MDKRQEEREKQIEDGIWRPRIFKAFSEIDCLMATKNFGYGWTNLRGPKLFKDQPKVMIDLCRAIDPNLDPDKVVLLNFSYQDKIVFVNEEIIEGYKNRTKKLVGVDGVISNLAGSALMFLIADCVPTAIYDSKNKAIGIFHSSWHSMALNIVGKGVARMVQEFGSKPEDLLAVVGPAFSQNFEVKDDVLAFFKKNKQFSDEELAQIFAKVDEEHYHLDLFLAIRLQLQKAGVLENQIEITNLRTDLDNDLFPSFRLEKDESDRAPFIMYLKP